MANADASATYWNTPQYHGQLLTIGLTDKNCKFLNMIGGLGTMGRAGGAKTTTVLKFLLNSENAFDSPSQQDITEDETATTPTPRNSTGRRPSTTTSRYSTGASALAISP